MEEDNEFCYLALERCKCTLADAMASESARGKFVGPDGEPTAFAYQVARDIGRGLTALHERGIVHRWAWWVGRQGRPWWWVRETGAGVGTARRALAAVAPRLAAHLLRLATPPMPALFPGIPTSTSRPQAHNVLLTLFLTTLPQHLPTPHAGTSSPTTCC